MSANRIPVFDVLLVEDDLTEVALVSGLVARDEKRCVRLTACTSLAEALAALASRSFSAILLDLTLPDSAGFDTFDCLRRASGDAPILVRSGCDPVQYH